MLKEHFRRFLSADPERLHFASHSHHPWPDVTLGAQERAWLDAAHLADGKWEHIFDVVWPRAQEHVASELKLPSPRSIVFATNTHELVLRLLSCLEEHPRIVTSDSEFHSFERQARRLEEDGLVEVVRVPSEPFRTFPERLVAEVRRAKTQLVFFSHVFFDSGAVVDELPRLIAELPPGPLVVVDGYHGFLAVPTDLSVAGERAFYLAGGYKYAMAGEGACFLHVPPSLELRPRNTGWFAAFGSLSQKVAGEVPYASGGARFLGATFDPSGLYRLNAVMRWRREVGLTTHKSRAHAFGLQRRFVEALREGPIEREQLVVPLEAEGRGHFLTFRTGDAQKLAGDLGERRVVVDARGDRLRVGFGVYQDERDVDQMVERLSRGAPQRSRPAREKVAFLGAGTLVEHLLEGAFSAGSLEPRDVVCTTRRPERAATLRARGLTVLSNTEAVELADRVVLGVRHADLAALLAEVRPRLEGKSLISLVMGVPLDALEQAAPGARVVRVATSLGIAAARGLSALTPGPLATPGDMAFCRALFGPLGGVIEVAEDELNSFNAVNGAGPALVAAFAQAVALAAREVGVPEAAVGAAVRAALETVSASPVAFPELMAKVAPSGGASRVALDALDAGELGRMVGRAVEAAVARGVERDDEARRAGPRTE